MKASVSKIVAEEIARTDEEVNEKETKTFTSFQSVLEFHHRDETREKRSTPTGNGGVSKWSRYILAEFRFPISEFPALAGASYVERNAIFRDVKRGYDLAAKITRDDFPPLEIQKLFLSKLSEIKVSTTDKDAKKPSKDAFKIPFIVVASVSKSAKIACRDAFELLTQWRKENVRTAVSAEKKAIRARDDSFRAGALSVSDGMQYASDVLEQLKSIKGFDPSMLQKLLDSNPVVEVEEVEEVLEEVE